MTYAYLASPYSHPDPEVRCQRFEAARDACARLLLARRWVYSPIVHCHELATVHDLPKNFEFWWDYNAAMLAGATHLIILTLPGWEESRGVAAERVEARFLGIPEEAL